MTSTDNTKWGELTLTLKDSSAAHEALSRFSSGKEKTCSLSIEQIGGLMLISVGAAHIKRSLTVVKGDEVLHEWFIEFG